MLNPKIADKRRYKFNNMQSFARFRHTVYGDKVDHRVADKDFDAKNRKSSGMVLETELKCNARGRQLVNSVLQALVDCQADENACKKTCCRFRATQRGNLCRLSNMNPGTLNERVNKTI